MIVLPALPVHIGKAETYIHLHNFSENASQWGVRRSGPTPFPSDISPQVGFSRCIRVVNTILSVHFYPRCGLSNLLRSQCQVGHCSDYRRCTPSHPHPGWHCDCRPQRYSPLGKAILALVRVFVRRHFYRCRHYCRIGQAGRTHSNPMPKPHQHCPVRVSGCHWKRSFIVCINATLTILGTT